MRWEERPRPPMHLGVVGTSTVEALSVAPAIMV